MLRADLRRTRSTSAVLVGLIALAAMLAATAGAVLTQLTGSLDQLFERSRTPDIVQMHVGPVDVNAVATWAAQRPEVADMLVSTTLPIPVDELHLNGVSEAGSVLQPALTTQNERFDWLLGLDDEVLAVGPGEIALPVYYAMQRGVAVGDTVTLAFTDARHEFTVVAFLRDSTMNPTFVSSKRLLISQPDFDRIAPRIAQPEYLIEFRTHQRSDAAAVSTAYGVSGPATNGIRMERTLFYLANAMSHGIAIAVLTLLAVLLLSVALIAVRFSFLTAVERDLREIGVMKAIGLTAGQIRRLWLVKYIALAIIGGVIGLLLSIPAARTITSGLRMQLGDAGTGWARILVPFAGAVLIALVVIGLCAVMLRRLNRVSAVEALRAGASGGVRRVRGPRLRLMGLSTGSGKVTRLPVAMWMGLNDILRNTRAHAMLLVVLILCTFGMVVPLNVWTTFSSPKFATYLGTGLADLRLELRSEQAVAGAPKLITDLGNDPEVTRYAQLVSARFEVENPEGKWEPLVFENGDHTTFALSYLSGTAPTSADQVAFSSLAADGLNLKVGDHLVVRGRATEYPVTVSGIYQDVTNGGRTAKGVLPIAGEPIVWHTVLVDLADGADIGATGARIAAEHPGVQAIGMAEFARQTLGEVLDLTGTLTAVAAGVALVLAFLIATMFARLAIARDTSQIAVQRALGIGDRVLRRQYLTRFLTVLVFGVVLGTVLVGTLGEQIVALAAGSTLGAPAIRFDVNPWLAYAVFPLALALVVALATLISTRDFRATTVTQLAEE